MRLGASTLGLVLVAFGTAAAVAQEPVCQINGTIFGKDRKGVPGLTVAAIAASGSIYGTSSDEGGRYAFKGLQTDTYTIVVELPAAGVSRKDGIRARPLFRSIVDFNLVADAPGESPPALQPAEPKDGAGATGVSFACVLSGADREPAPDVGIIFTPIDGAGQLRRGRTDPDGRCQLADVPLGTYRISVRAPGFITWSLGPIPLKSAGSLKLSLQLVPFPMGFEGTLEDKLVPSDPIPPPTL